MTVRRLRNASWAFWLGLLALGLDMLVPVHFAFDLAEAVGAVHGRTAGTGFEWRLFALVSGHSDDRHAGHADHHHDAACAVCAAVGALGAIGGFAPPAAPALPAPVPASTAFAHAAGNGNSRAIFPAAYRSRAPPRV